MLSSPPGSEISGSIKILPSGRSGRRRVRRVCREKGGGVVEVEVGVVVGVPYKRGE